MMRETCITLLVHLCVEYLYLVTPMIGLLTYRPLIGGPTNGLFPLQDLQDKQLILVQILRNLGEALSCKEYSTLVLSIETGPLFPSRSSRNKKSMIVLQGKHNHASG